MAFLDIYSFAIVMWELTHRRPPHETLTPQVYILPYQSSYKDASI